MLGSLVRIPNYDHLFTSGNGEPGGGGEGGSGNTPGSGGSGGNTNSGEAQGSGSGEKQVAQSEVDRIVQSRVGETKRSTEEAIAKDLGVDLAEAKRLIAAAQAADDKDKSEAQLAREKADKEAKEAEGEKSAAAKERHEASVERALVRAIKVPADVKDDDADEWIDRKVARLIRLVDVEIGADAAAIKAAVEALRTDEPLLFGADSGTSSKPSAPNSDPKGTPPKGKATNESAFDRGAARAKDAARPSGYKILEGNKQ